MPYLSVACGENTLWTSLPFGGGGLLRGGVLFRAFYKLPQSEPGEFSSPSEILLPQIREGERSMDFRGTFPFWESVQVCSRLLPVTLRVWWHWCG